MNKICKFYQQTLKMPKSEAYLCVISFFHLIFFFFWKLTYQPSLDSDFEPNRKPIDFQQLTTAANFTNSWMTLTKDQRPGPQQHSTLQRPDEISTILFMTDFFFYNQPQSLIAACTQLKNKSNWGCFVRSVALKQLFKTSVYAIISILPKHPTSTNISKRIKNYKIVWGRGNKN